MPSSSAPPLLPLTAIRSPSNSLLSMIDSLKPLGAKAFQFSVYGNFHAVAGVLASSARRAVNSRLARGRNTSPISALHSMKVSCAARL